MFLADDDNIPLSLARIRAACIWYNAWTLRSVFSRRLKENKKKGNERGRKGLELTVSSGVLCWILIKCVIAASECLYLFLLPVYQLYHYPHATFPLLTLHARFHARNHAIENVFRDEYKIYKFAIGDYFFYFFFSRNKLME